MELGMVRCTISIDGDTTGLTMEQLPGVARCLAYGSHLTMEYDATETSIDELIETLPDVAIRHGWWMRLQLRLIRMRESTARTNFGSAVSLEKVVQQAHLDAALRD